MAASPRPTSASNPAAGPSTASPSRRSISTATCSARTSRCVNNIITNPGTSVLYTLGGPDTVTLTNNHITGVTSSGGSLDAVFIAGNWNGTTGTQVSISGNVFNGSPGALRLQPQQRPGTIANNTIDGLSYYGFLLANNTNVDVTGNTFANIVNPDPTVGSWGAGVRTYTPGPFFGLNLDGNTFTDNAVGLGIRAGSDVAPGAITITNNVFNGTSQTTSSTRADDDRSDAERQQQLRLGAAVRRDRRPAAGAGRPRRRCRGQCQLRLGRAQGRPRLSHGRTASSRPAGPPRRACSGRSIPPTTATPSMSAPGAYWPGAATTTADNLTVTAPAGATGLALRSAPASTTSRCSTTATSTSPAMGSPTSSMATSGNNTLTGGLGNDTINGGAGNDLIQYTVGDGVDTINGGADTDTLAVSGTAGNDTIHVAVNGSGVITSIEGMSPTNVEQRQRQRRRRRRHARLHRHHQRGDGQSRHAQRAPASPPWPGSRTSPAAAATTR